MEDSTSSSGTMIPCEVTWGDGTTGVVMVPYEDWKRAARDAGIID